MRECVEGDQHTAPGIEKTHGAPERGLALKLADARQRGGVSCEAAENRAILLVRGCGYF